MLKFKSYVFIFLSLLALSTFVNADSFQDIKDKYGYTNKHIKAFTLKKCPDLFLSDNKRDKNFSYEAKNIFQLAVSNMKRYSYEKYTKVILEFDSRSEDQVSEYYYYDSKIYFVFKVVTEYTKNKDDDDFLKIDKKTFEDRFYFNNGKMIRWVNSKKIKVNINSDKYMKYEKEVLSDADTYFKLSEK